MTNITPERAARLAKRREDQANRQAKVEPDRRSCTERERAYFPPGAREAFNKRFSPE